MRVRMEISKTLADDDLIREHLKRRTERLKRRLRGFGCDRGELLVRLSAERGSIRCLVDLALPGRRLVARKEAYQAVAAIRAAFDALVREFERYRYRAYASLSHSRAAVSSGAKISVRRSEPGVKDQASRFAGRGHPVHS